MMTLALALALQGGPTQPPTVPLLPFGRVYTNKSLHVGVRPMWIATGGDLVYGVTVQVTWLHLL
jgi:hypothetical protein